MRVLRQLRYREGSCEGEALRRGGTSDRQQFRLPGARRVFLWDDLPPRHSGLYGPGWGPDGDGDRRAWVQYPGRVPSRAAPRQAWRTLDGERRPEHRRVAVLYYARGDAVVGRQARGLRGGRRWHGSRRRHQGAGPTARPGAGRQDRADRDRRVTPYVIPLVEGQHAAWLRQTACQLVSTSASCWKVSPRA